LRYAQKIDPNIQNKYGNTPLQIAVMKNQIDVVNILLNQYKAKYSIKNNDNETAYDLAMKCNSTDIKNIFNELSIDLLIPENILEHIQENNASVIEPHDITLTDVDVEHAKTPELAPKQKIPNSTIISTKQL